MNVIFDMSFRYDLSFQIISNEMIDEWQLLELVLLGVCIEVDLVLLGIIHEVGSSDNTYSVLVRFTWSISLFPYLVIAVICSWTSDHLAW